MLKHALKEELLALLRADLETCEHAHKATLQAATHEEAKPENDKDTRALEQSYLARGQSLRVIELKTAVAEVRGLELRDFENAPAAIGALVTAIEDDTAHVFFLAPHGGGSKLDDGKVQVVTHQSPLGRALFGKRSGDECEIKLANKTRTLVIERIE